MQQQKNLFPIERRKKILEIVEKEGRITVCDIQRIFLVGYETAKKDLAMLEEENKLKRVYGGAISLNFYRIDFSEYAHELNNFFVTEEITNEKVYLDHSIRKILTNDFWLIQNDYFTNSFKIAQEIISNNRTVGLLGSTYDSQGYTYNLPDNNDNFDISCIALFYDDESATLWIDSQIKYDFFSKILSNSKSTLVLTESKHIKKEGAENMFEFHLTNLKEAFPLAYYTEN